MTKATYEKARREALERYLNDAHRDYINAVNSGHRNIAANAKRRIAYCYKTANEREKHGFWTEKEKIVYEMCYKHLPENDVMAISAV